jgi:hypothetical protein
MGHKDGPKAPETTVAIKDFNHGLGVGLKEWPAAWFQGFGLFFSAWGLGASFARHSAAFPGLSQVS